MKHLYLLLVVVFLSAPVLAEKRYVIDELRVPLRDKPCGRCRIIYSGLKSGNELTLIEDTRPAGQSENWSHVKTRSGKTGWLPSQYLNKQQVAKVRIKNVEASLTALQEKNQQLQQQLTEFETLNTELQAQSSELNTSHQDLSNELSQIKQISGNAITLQNQNEELLKRNKMLQNEVDILSATTEQLRTKDSQTWFFYGGLAVLMGALLSVVLPQFKRRKKFSEWG